MSKEARNSPVLYPDKERIVLNRDGTVNLKPSQYPLQTVEKFLTPTSALLKRN